MFQEFLDSHLLKTLFVPARERAPFPRCADRAAWEGIPGEMRAQILLDAGKRQAEPYPALPAARYMAFVRAGDRQDFETPYFDRRKKLLACALACCVAPAPGLLEDVSDGIWLLCEECAWNISAHSCAEHWRGQHVALPDPADPFVDLFAAQTAALLNLTVYLLGDVLDGVSTMLRRRVLDETERRVIGPFFGHDDFWWMGFVRSDLCNWTPWIVSNILLCLLLSETDEDRLEAGFVRGLKMLDRWLACIPEDGGSEEGAAYWNMAGGALLDCLETLRLLTGGRADFYGDPLVRDIGLFPLRAHAAGPWFINFADCDARPALDGERVYLYGRRIGCARLMALGSQIQRQAAGSPTPDTPEFSRVLNRLFDRVPELPAPEKEAVFLPKLQLWADHRGRLTAAAKGGVNAGSHSHNDAGSFFLYADGKPEVVDLGNMTYTAKTFGPERLSLPQVRSGNHNLPLIGGVEQGSGERFGASAFRPCEGGVEMELAGAWPGEAGLRAFSRKLCWKGGALALEDAIHTVLPRTAQWVFMLRNRPAVGTGEALFGRLRLRFDPALRAACVEFPVTDPRMARSFPGSLWRLTLSAGEALEQRQSFLMEIAGERADEHGAD